MLYVISKLLWKILGNSWYLWHISLKFMLLPIQISFFKGHIPCLSLIRARSNKNWASKFQPSVLVRRGWGWCRKIIKQTLENKEGLKAAAPLLNISQYRENGEDSSLIFPRQQNKERLNNHTIYRCIYRLRIKTPDACFLCSSRIHTYHFIYHSMLIEYLHDCAMQLYCVFTWHACNVTPWCSSYVSPQLTCSPAEFSVAQCLEHPTSVWKIMGSIPIWNSEFFPVFFSPHISFHLLTII